MNAPSNFVAKRRLALATERLDELEQIIDAREGRHEFHPTQAELNEVIDEYLVASVAAGEITREALVSNLRMDGLRVPQELLKAQS